MWGPNSNSSRRSSAEENLVAVRCSNKPHEPKRNWRRMSERKTSTRKWRVWKLMLITYDEMFRTGSETRVVIKWNPNVQRETPRKVKTSNPSVQVLKMYKDIKQKKALKKRMWSSVSCWTRRRVRWLGFSSKPLRDRRHWCIYTSAKLQRSKKSHEVWEQHKQLLSGGDKHIEENPKTERLVEEACDATGSLSSQEHEDKIKSWEYKKNMLLKTIKVDFFDTVT